MCLEDGSQVHPGMLQPYPRYRGVWEPALAQAKYPPARRAEPALPEQVSPSPLGKIVVSKRF